MNRQEVVKAIQDAQDFLSVAIHEARGEIFEDDLRDMDDQLTEILDWIEGEGTDQ